MLIGLDASRAFSRFIGGPENYSYYLIRALLKAPSSHRFRLYLRPDSKESPRYQRFFSDLEMVNCELKVVPWPFLWTQAGLALECFRNPPDVLFVPAHTIPLLRPGRLKTIVAIHDLGAEFLPNYHKFPQKYYLNFATEYAVRQATRVITVSQHTKKDVLGKFKVPSSKCEVIYEGYEEKLFFPRKREEIEKAKERYGIRGDYLFFVGTIQPRKNLVRLIEAYSKLIVNCQLSIEEAPSLVLAGSPGWLYEDIYGAPQRFGVADRVRFLGRIEDDALPALLSGCRAFVFPSLFEGFGLSLLEAMACGATTITSKTTSLPEVGGQAPIYVDPYRTDELTQALEKVLKMGEDERRQLSQRSISQAAKFTWEKSASDVLAIIDNI